MFLRCESVGIRRITPLRSALPDLADHSAVKAFAAACSANAGTWRAHVPLARMPIAERRATMFIVQGKPREPEGIAIPARPALH